MQHRNSTPHPAISKGVQEKTEISWFWPIKSREEALEIVQLASWLLFIIAGLLAILSFLASIYPDVGLHWQDYVLDLLLYAAFGVWLRWGHSRVAALLSFSLALLSLGTTIAAKAGLTEGGKNIWLAVGLRGLRQRLSKQHLSCMADSRKCLINYRKRSIKDRGL